MYPDLERVESARTPKSRMKERREAEGATPHLQGARGRRRSSSSSRVEVLLLQGGAEEEDALHARALISDFTSAPTVLRLHLLLFPTDGHHSSTSARYCHLETINRTAHCYN